MKKVKKYKLKTHKGTKKRFKQTGTGKLVKLKGRLIKKSKISKNAKRTLGKAQIVSPSYIKTLRKQLLIKSSDTRIAKEPASLKTEPKEQQ